MTASNVDFLGHADWRKRIHQLKQELRSGNPEQRLIIPEQGKAYGTDRKGKPGLPSSKSTIPNREIPAQSPAKAIP